MDATLRQAVSDLCREVEELRAEVLGLRDAVTRRDELVERFMATMAASAGWVQAEASAMLSTIRSLDP